MKYILNNIGITTIAILFATATCNNTNSSTEETSTTDTPQTEMVPVVEKVSDTIIPQEKRDTVEIKTTMGNITVVLYNETPLHRDNFLKLVNSKFYDGILFHRVIRGFMIQTGDPLSKDGDPNNDGTGGPGYRVPKEFIPGLKHVKGTLAAARDGNPEMASSGSQFYICHAAAPWLDGQYTIFGETIAGIDVVDKIAEVQVGPNDRPTVEIKIISARHVNAPKAEKGKKAEKAGKGSK